MKNISNKGFVLAETLVVAVFLMTIFSLIYKYFYPLMGEYEKREVYDSVDDKYSVYWLKRMIEDSSYKIKTDDKGNAKRKHFNDYGYVRFECSDISDDYDRRQTCKTLVKALEVRGCDKIGNGCDIFLTKYTIGRGPSTQAVTNSGAIFKEKVKEAAPKLLRYQESCTSNNNVCETNYINNLCPTDAEDPDVREQCVKIARKRGQQKVFDSGFIDYLDAIPDYTAGSLNGAEYRVTAIFHHKRGGNNYYSYATIEVNR